MKLPVSAAALDRFGPDHELRTFLAVDGDDLWLIGTGDPAHRRPRHRQEEGGEADHDARPLGRALKARGVTAIRGTCTTTTARSTTSRPPDLEPVVLTDWYAAPVAGLNFNDNCGTDGPPRRRQRGPATTAHGRREDRAAFEVMRRRRRLGGRQPDVTNGRATPTRGGPGPFVTVG
jgi:D-alanyl-D-alanine carboxypeptidase